MRIAIVNSNIGRKIVGHITLLKLAELLAKGNDVDVVYYKIPEVVVKDALKFIGNAKLVCLMEGDAGGFMYTAKYSYGGIPDIILFNYLKRTQYDAIIVVSSGPVWWLAFLYKVYIPERRPVVCLVPTDPPLGASITFYETGKHSGSKGVKENIIKTMQRFRLKYFDVVFGQSNWTNKIFEKYFDVNPVGLAGAFDDRTFKFTSNESKSEPYIAVPTVSLDVTRMEIIRRLYADGIKMRLYGPKKVGVGDEPGYVQEGAMVDILRSASSALFLFDYEGLGLIPFESLALGTPVITEARLGPYSELYDNKYVRFVDIDNYDEILNACRRSLNSKISQEERREISESIRDRTFQNFAITIEGTLRKVTGA